MLERSLHFLNVGGEVLVEYWLVTKINDKNLVVLVAGPYQVQRSLVHLIAFFAHGTRIVDNDSHCNRIVLALEQLDRLRLIVFEYREIRLCQGRDQPVPLVNDSGVQNDFASFRVKDVNSVVIRGRPLRRSTLLPRGRCATWFG